MMSSGLQPVQLAIQHVRHRGQGMPVPGMSMNMCECPGNAGDAQTARYLSIFIDVVWVIIVDEIVLEGVAKNNPGECREKDADSYIYPAAVCSGGSSRSCAESVHVWRCECGEGERLPYLRSRSNPALKAAICMDKG